MGQPTSCSKSSRSSKACAAIVGVAVAIFVASCCWFSMRTSPLQSSLTTRALGEEYISNKSLSPTKMALLIRGYLWRANYTPISSARHILHPYEHDFLAEAWPAMRANIIDEAAERCGYSVDVFIGTYQGLSPDYLDRVRRTTEATHIFEYSQHGMRQFDLAIALLKEFRLSEGALGEQYKLVIVTRDDFVYSEFFWQALSERYEVGRLNLVNTDCVGAAWDGLHVFAPSQIKTFIHGFSGMSFNAHSLYRYVPLRAHYWFNGSFGQPDRCRPPLGIVSRRQARRKSVIDRCCTYGEHIAPVLARVLDGQASCPRLAGRADALRKP